MTQYETSGLASFAAPSPAPQQTTDDEVVAPVSSNITLHSSLLADSLTELAGALGGGLDHSQHLQIRMNGDSRRLTSEQPSQRNSSGVYNPFDSDGMIC